MTVSTLGSRLVRGQTSHQHREHWDSHPDQKLCMAILRLVTSAIMNCDTQQITHKRNFKRLQERPHDGWPD